MKYIWMLFVMLLPATAGAGGWSLDGDRSDISFVSVKKGSVAEVHHFTTLSGSIKNGQANIAIDLTSVESGIKIRNERMRSMLFEVGSFATATITADISGVDAGKLNPGETLSVSLPLTLGLHGFHKVLKADVTVIALNDGLLVTSRRPVIVKASDFGLEAGIETLRKIAKLPSIAYAVPVSFQLYFK